MNQFLLNRIDAYETAVKALEGEAPGLYLGKALVAEMALNDLKAALRREAGFQKFGDNWVQHNGKTYRLTAEGDLEIRTV